MIGKSLWVSARANLGCLTRSRGNAWVRKRTPLGLLARAAWVIWREAYWVSARARGRHRGPWRMGLTVPRAATHRITYIDSYINNAASACRAWPIRARHRLPFRSSSARGKATSRCSATAAPSALPRALMRRRAANGDIFTTAQNVAQCPQPTNALRERLRLDRPAGAKRESRVGPCLVSIANDRPPAACLAFFRSLCVAFARKRLPLIGSQSRSCQHSAPAARASKPKSPPMIREARSAGFRGSSTVRFPANVPLGFPIWVRP